MPNDDDIKSFNLDEIYDEIGHFGVYQLVILLLVSFTATIAATNAYSLIFTSAKPEFRCKIPFLDNDTYEIQGDFHRHLIELYIPLKQDGTYETCLLNVFNTSTKISNASYETSCNQYVYSKEYYTKTLVSDWNLVCDKESIKSTFTSLYFIGYFGVILVGILGDNYGRKKISYIFIALCSISSILTAILTNRMTSLPLSVKELLYGILILLNGVFSNVYIIGMVLAVELVGPRYRLLASNAFYYSYIVGELIVLAFATTAKDYNLVNVCMAVFMTSFVFYFWYVPESPRFLVTQGRYREAARVFQRIARSNRREFDVAKITRLSRPSSDSDIENDEIAADETSQLVASVNTNKRDNSTNKKSFFSKLMVALKSGKFRIRLLVTMLNWLGNTFAYDGLSFNIGALGGNPYLNYIYSAVVELAGLIASHIALEKLGRKKPYCICLVLAGLSLVSISFVPSHMTGVITGMALAGKFFISFTFNAVYIVTAEAYPTEIRNTAVSFCSAQSRIGGAIAPYVQLLGSLYWFPLPFLIYGASALLAAVSYIIFMPETRGLKMADNLEDMKDEDHTI